MCLFHVCGFCFGFKRQCEVYVPNKLRDYPSFSEDKSKLRTKIIRSLLYLNYLIAITDIACVVLRMSMEDY